MGGRSSLARGWRMSQRSKLARRSRRVKKKRRKGTKRRRKRTRRGPQPHPNLRRGQQKLVPSSGRWAGCPWEGQCWAFQQVGNQ